MSPEAFDELSTRCINCKSLAYDSCGHGVMTDKGYVCRMCSGQEPGLPGGIEITYMGKPIK